MAIMSALAELHQEPELKLNLKFEIEVLCKNLNLDVGVSIALSTETIYEAVLIISEFLITNSSVITN